MATETVIATVAILAGVLGGIASPILAWAASNDNWNHRKFVGALLTGIISGLGWSAIALANPPTAGITAAAIFGIQTFLATVGIDYARNKLSGMIRNQPNQPPTP